MSHCILHIGWHKTGTTALQQVLSANSDRLATTNIHYPDFNHNHGPALVSTYRQDDGHYFAETFIPPRAKYAHRAPADWGDEVLRDAMKTAKGGTLVLSGEDCVLLRLPEISALAADLKAHFDKTTVVAYVRNHRDYLNSAVQQLVRMGFPISAVLAMAEPAKQPSPPLRVMSALPSYGTRLRDWITAFGRDNVKVHSYDLIRQNGQDIVGHFVANHLNERAHALIDTPQHRTNNSFSAIAVDLLDRLHSRAPPMLNGEPNPKFASNLQRFFGKIDGPAFQA